MKRSSLRKTGKSETSKLQKKCDSLLTPIIKKKYPKCEGCGINPTTVAHHWIEKSRSSNLRYDLRNIIPLCAVCHVKIHNRFGNNVVGGVDIADKIINKRGKVWKRHMDEEANVIVKTNKAWYESKLAELEKNLLCG